MAQFSELDDSDWFKICNSATMCPNSKKYHFYLLKSVKKGWLVQKWRHGENRDGAEHFCACDANCDQLAGATSAAADIFERQT